MRKGDSLLTGQGEGEGRVAGGLPSKFHSVKIPRKELETVFVIPQKKVLIPPKFRASRNSLFQGSEWNGTNSAEE
jgi:hypothetical protein